MVKKTTKKAIEFHSVKVDTETYKLVKYLSKKFDVSAKDVLSIAVNFLSKNPSLIVEKKKDNNFTFETDILADLTTKMTKSTRTEINRLIGFIKVQDEFLSKMKNDLMFKLDKEDNPEYHPLFGDYDTMLKYIYYVLEKRGITEKNIKDDISKIMGKDKLHLFLQSELRTTRKTLKI